MREERRRCCSKAIKTSLPRAHTETHATNVTVTFRAITSEECATSDLRRPRGPLRDYPPLTSPSSLRLPAIPSAIMSAGRKRSRRGQSVRPSRRLSPRRAVISGTQRGRVKAAPTFRRIGESGGPKRALLLVARARAGTRPRRNSVIAFPIALGASQVPVRFPPRVLRARLLRIKASGREYARFP